MTDEFHPEIIAEIGVNFLGSIDLAKYMIRQAKYCGCSTAKFQLYSVDALFPDKKIMAQGRNWYSEVKRCELSREQVTELATYCDGVGIEFLCSAFDLERLSWLEELHVRRHKIASLMNKNVDYLKAVCQTGKPILISCMPGDYIPFPSSLYSYLYCVPHYPTKLRELHFSQISFPYKYIGFSDHTVGIEAAMVAFAKGAQLVEKHFTLAHDLLGPDHICSATPEEMRRLVGFAGRMSLMLGDLTTL